LQLLTPLPQITHTPNLPCTHYPPPIVHLLRRYFVLNDNAITYFKDHKSTDIPKGDVLLTEDTTIDDFEDKDYQFGFIVSTQFVKMKMVAKDAQERNEWKQKIRMVVSDLAASSEMGHAVRGYLSKSGRFLEAKHVRKFFMLHNDCLTYHQDLYHTSVIQGMRKFSGRTTVEEDGERTLIMRTNLRDGKYWKLKADSREERDNWVKGIRDKVSKLGFLEVDYEDTTVADLQKDCLRSGYLNVRPKEGGADWDDQFFVLSKSRLYQFHDDDADTPNCIHMLSPNCSVFETKLKESSFELVTNSRVLHVQGANSEETYAWIKILRKSISESQELDENPLLDAAKKQKSIFYDVTFETKKPLGLVLERSGEWALVKLANQETTHVSIGSALTNVNGKDVILSNYQDTIRMLTAWQPPLSLGFRLAPEKRGWLTKQGRGRKSKRKNWKPRYFVLAEGRLSYFSNDGPDAVLKGVIHLMGSAVSLVPRSETSQYFCFKVVSGITGIVMQGLTVEDMMDWASSIYHAISVANGGGYLLELERERLKEVEEEKRKIAEKLAAEEQLATKQREAEEAAARAEQLRQESADNSNADLQRLAKAAEEAEAAASQEAITAASAVDTINTELAERELRTVEPEEEEEEEPTAWQAYWNSEHSVWYYYNIETEETRWERPEGEEITINQPDEWKKVEEPVSVVEEGAEVEVDAEATAEAAAEAVEEAAPPAAVEEAVEEVAASTAEEEVTEKVSQIEFVDMSEEETPRVPSIRVPRAKTVEQIVPPPAVQSSISVETADADEAEEVAREVAPPAAPEPDAEEAAEEKPAAEVERPVVLQRQESERRRSLLPTAAPLAPLVAPEPVVQVEEDSDESDDDEDSAFRGSALSEESSGVVELTNDELISVFETVDHGATRGQLNPMLFGTLIRAVTMSNANLFAEMKMFSQFNTSGDGVIDLNEWLDGVRKIAGEPGGLQSPFYKGLVKYHQSSSVML
jgi:hypothetical protein